MLKIIDNFIPLQDQIELEKFLISNNLFPYFHSIDTVESYEEQVLINDPLVLHQPQFVHILFNNTANSNAFEPVISKLNFKNLGLGDYKFKRVKVNLLTPSIENYPEKYHVPHFDSKNPNDITIIYYVNNSNGDTVLFNESYEGLIPTSVSVKQTISPLRGRVLIFNSNQFHASRPPYSIDYRCVINIVLT
jgi:hypothetical protein